jgi:putative SOS response-associated peptidase YedK
VAAELRLAGSGTEVETDPAGFTWPGPSWNISPGQAVGSVQQGNSGPVLGPLAFGFAAPGVRQRWIFNARFETLVDKAVFRVGLERRRVAVPVDGYYEWQREAGVKQPYFVSHPTGRLWLAGVANPQAMPAGVAIITRPAPSQLDWLHSRAPAVLDNDTLGLWLCCSLSLDEAASLVWELVSHDAASFSTRPVATTVNSSRADGPELLTTLPSAAQPRLPFG